MKINKTVYFKGTAEKKVIKSSVDLKEVLDNVWYFETAEAATKAGEAEKKPAPRAAKAAEKKD